MIRFSVYLLICSSLLFACSSTQTLNWNRVRPAKIRIDDHAQVNLIVDGGPLAAAVKARVVEGLGAEGVVFSTDASWSLHIQVRSHLYSRVEWRRQRENVCLGGRCTSRYVNRNLDIPTLRADVHIRLRHRSRGEVGRESFRLIEDGVPSEWTMEIHLLERRMISRIQSRVVDLLRDRVEDIAIVFFEIDNAEHDMILALVQRGKLEEAEARANALLPTLMLAREKARLHLNLANFARLREDFELARKHLSEAERLSDEEHKMIVKIREQIALEQKDHRRLQSKSPAHPEAAPPPPESYRRK